MRFRWQRQLRGMNVERNMSRLEERGRPDKPEFTSRAKGFRRLSGTAPGPRLEAPGPDSGSVSAPRCSSSDLERSLLTEIDRLGGQERARGAKGALEMFHASLSELVAQNPQAYGAGDDPKSQHRIVAHLLESVKTPFLARTVAGLRQEAGYVLVFGYWIHRAVFTFVGFGLLAAVALPLCAVSLMSTQAWGWLPGALGIVATLGAGAWILSRIRER
jgi:hypothetical protein